VSGDDLITQFLDAVKDLSPREAARLSGVNYTTITNWRDGERGGKVLASTTRKLRAFLERGAAATPEPTLGLEERLSAVEREAGGDVVRLAFAYDALAAVIRGEAALVEARAALTRADAMREAEQAARERGRAPMAPLDAFTPVPRPGEKRKGTGRKRRGNDNGLG
jgi:hypothetical protein